MLEPITQPRRPAICAIVPAYNEGPYIGAVLEALRLAEFLTEILVVDDGSSDGMAAAAQQAARRDPRLRLLRHETNRGKGQAIFTAWTETKAPFLLLLDADLHALKPSHLADLMAPVLSFRADMTLGLFSGGHFATDMSHRLTPFLTGQRGLRADLLEHVSPEAAAGYGFELALTIAARQQGSRVCVVPLQGVWHPPSEVHRGVLGGLAWRGGMYAQILRAWYVAALQRHPGARAFLSSILRP